jgi:hypothetical protein
VPERPFLIEPMSDPGNNVCPSPEPDDCKIGPWLMIFETLPGGKLKGSLVSARQAQQDSDEYDNWGPGHGFEAAEFQLQSDDSVYRLAPRSRATLATYSYDVERVPGVCLVAPGKIEWRSHVGTAFNFFDEDGDGEADGVVLSGNVVGLGDRGGDYEYDCGYETFPIETRGHVVDTTVQLDAEGNALQPVLLAREGFLQGGSASVRGPEGWVEARPLKLSGFTYGYAADVVLQPGAPLDWKFDVVDSFDRKLEDEGSFGDVETWREVEDGGFEDPALGTVWGDLNSVITDSCNPNLEDAEALGPIGGTRSLAILRDGYRDQFRLVRTASDARLTFVAFGKVNVELATVGSLDPAPFDRTPVVTPADCDTYAAFCAQVPEGALKHYSVELPEGDGDVLVRLTNEDHTLWATSGGHDLCVDDLQLE